MTDRVRDLIIRKMREKGFTERSLSLAIGKNAAYINQFIKRRIPEYLYEDERTKIAEILNIDEKLLRSQKDPQKNNVYNKNPLLPKVAGVIGEVTFGPDSIPILGHANGASDLIIINADQEIGRALRHPNQQGIRNAFALYAQGESMSPRYEAGDLVYVAADKPPSSGQDCIVELENGEGYLKKFIRRTDREIICKQLNPPKEWKKLIADVKAIHAVVGRG